MAKTIKFNLICDDKPIRTVEDLQENFSIEDVLMYYRKGLLQRWLEVREYKKELEEVEKIKNEDSLSIVKDLIKIFDVSSDKKEIEEGVYMIEFLNERKDLCSIYEQNKFKAESIIDDYQSGYTQLVHGILDNPNDVARIKANIEEIASNYGWAFNLNHRELFWNLYDTSVLAIMCLLMNEKTRGYFLPKERVDTSISPDDSNNTPSVSSETDVEKKCDIQEDRDKKDMYEAICKLPVSYDFAEKLGDNLLTFAGETDGYWKDLEPKGKKYMIISMGSGDYVRPAGLSGVDMSSKDVINLFVIIDGVDYKSNSAARKLLYMEV